MRLGSPPRRYPLTSCRRCNVGIQAALYREHRYTPIHRRYEYDPAEELVRMLDKLRGETRNTYNLDALISWKHGGLDSFMRVISYLESLAELRSGISRRYQAMGR